MKNSRDSSLLRVIAVAAVAALVAVGGLAFGVGAFTFVYAKGASYLTNDPAACANCHVMQEQFDGWVHSSHRSVAVCNDCHTPPGLVLMLHPMDSPGDPLYLEHQGLSDDPGNPCGTIGLPGGPGGIGPKVPTLVR